MKVLVIEDDKAIADYVAKGLRELGYGVDVARDGAEGADLACCDCASQYDAAVIDIMLPEVDGLTIIEQMRGAGITVPVLILSAKRSVDDRVKGLRAGGDDYMVKPFSFSELEARIEALIRRSSSVQSGDGNGAETTLRVADLELDPWKHEVHRGGQIIALQPREFRLLEFLVRNVGRVVTKTAILEYVYEYHFDPQTNVIDVLIHRLRSKIDKGFEPKLIHTIRGAGYVLRAK